MHIGSVKIGPGQPCRIVAEISNNHNGNRDRCGRLIDLAQLAGADIVKFQAYLPEELVALRGDGPAPEPWGRQGYTMRTLYEKAQTPLEWFPKIAAHCERIGMPWFSSVFGSKSLTALEKVGCPAYKISHFERHTEYLIHRVEATHKPVLVSGIVSDGFNDAYGGTAKVYCPGGYPADIKDMHLQELRSGYWIGLSSHCLDPLVAPIAVANGAKYIEMHFMSDTEPSELESNVSMTPADFRLMVDRVRKAEALL